MEGTPAILQWHKYRHNDNERKNRTFFVCLWLFDHTVWPSLLSFLLHVSCQSSAQKTSIKRYKCQCLGLFCATNSNAWFNDIKWAIFVVCFVLHFIGQIDKRNSSNIFLCHLNFWADSLLKLFLQILSNIIVIFNC